MEGKPRSSKAKKVTASAAILAAVGSFVSYGVFSSFSDSVSNSSNLSSAAFGLTKILTLPVSILDLIPGDLVIRCYSVKNDSSVPVQAAIALSKGGDTGLGSGIDVVVKEGTGATTASGVGCGTFNATATVLGSTNLSDSVDAVIAASPNISNPTDPTSTGDWQYRAGTALWGAGETKQYQVSYKLPTTVGLSLADKAVNPTLTWVATQQPGTSR